MCLVFVCCRPQVKNINNKELNVINIYDGYSHKTEINLSQIADHVEYIQLESKRECLINEALRLFLSKEYIITMAFKQIYVFDRRSGKFIREIGHYGKDPNGFRNTLFVMPYNEQKETVYAKGWDSQIYYEYSLSNELINSIRTPLNSYSFCCLNDSVSVAYIKNYSGEETRKLVTFNKSNSSIHIFSNYSKFKKTNDVALWMGHGWFYKFDKDLFFFELFNDTIFQVFEDKLIPKYCFKMGKYSPPYEKQASAKFMREEANNFFLVRNIFESSNNIFFSIDYQHDQYAGFYNKNNNKVSISTNRGFFNDLDNFIPFSPKSIYNNDYLIGFTEANEILEWFLKNPELAAKLPANLQKFKNLKETDNPIVMIAKIKK